MSTEQILKFQPDRTIYMRGFDGTGAAASLCQASPTGFTVYGVFRDMADFCVLVLYDADNIFEHYSVKYLPDFNLKGMVLSFDVAYQGLQPLDSAKYSWIDWAQIDVIDVNGNSPANPIRLWDYANFVSGNYSVAQGTYTFSAPNGCYKYDRLTLFVNNAEFDFVSWNGGESAADVANWFAASINTYPWWTYTNSGVAVLASVDGTGNLTLKYARTGSVNVSGTIVTWAGGIKFPGIAPGSTIYIGGTQYTVAAVGNATTLTLTSDAGSQTGAGYLAEYGGVDGNGLTIYMVVRPGNINLHVNNPVLQLSGGNSDNVVWNISLDFTALGWDQLRQAWITFAPQLPASGAYADTEWAATFTNWSVADPNNIRPLQIAGPNSARVGNGDSENCKYSGNGWALQPANNYWRGFARATSEVGDQLTVSYSCTQTHDLYLGTSLYKYRGVVSVSVDGDTATNLNSYLKSDSEVVTRRLLRTGLTPGNHLVTINLIDPGTATSNSPAFIFDYIEAAVPTPNIPDAVVTYQNVSPALDFDTDATYKVSPQRLLWHILKLGFKGQLNEYLGVFWWNQRKRLGGVWNSATVTVQGDWANGNWLNTDYATVSIGGFTMTKSIITWDTPDTIANHFVYYINSSTISMWAEYTGPGQLTIHARTPNWGNTVSVKMSSAAGTISCSTPSIDAGDPGVWQVDPSAANPINFPIRQWHSDLFQQVQAAGLLITTSFSMELVNPPDDGTVANAWQARFYDGSPVATDTGFAELFSSQCAFIDNMTAFQKSVFTTMAGLQSAAGLTPWLQFGEFLWWFFSSISQSIFSCSDSNPVAISLMDSNGKQIPHGMATGDRVLISGVRGCTAANGTWPITVIDANTFSVPVASNGAWTSGTGQARGGSMAYYDAVTSAAAQAALGRPLYKFTCQDDDPTVNDGADTAFLASRLKAHVDAIREAVLAEYPNAKFELLYPNDVNHPVCFLGPAVAYPQGGRLNATVNLPPDWMAQNTSGLDRLKIEALSWGATYLTMDRASQAIVFALTPPMSWDKENIAYLVPWFNGTCPWPREYLLASSRGLGLINLWAYDHLSLMSWPVPFPQWLRKSGFAG